VRIGEVQTRARNVVQGLMPLPSASGQDMESLLLAEPLAMEALLRAPSRRPSRSKAANCSNGSRAMPAAEQVDPPAEPSLFAQEETAADVAAILAEMALEPDCTFQPAAQLFQDFTVRCRMQRLGDTGIDLAAFRRRFAMAVAGIADDSEPRWQDVLRIGRDVPDDLLAPFLVLARGGGGHAMPRRRQAGRSLWHPFAGAHPPSAGTSRTQRPDRGSHRLRWASFHRHSGTGLDYRADGSLTLRYRTVDVTTVFSAFANASGSC
jgi:hypothetical protein